MNSRTGKNIRKLLGITALLLATTSIFALSAMAGGPNYATSTHHSIAIYDGYIQCQPSYVDNGYHAARGFFVYRNGWGGGEQWAYTSYGQNAQDGAIYSASMRYWDTLNPFAPKVTFNYNFDWVPFGSGIWPY
ncbi:MAG: hypothetical protein KGZ53_02025 [Peptococcaceae bacterium]|nr:hypothetical protein [Peptococcaceae bacterium]